MMIRVFITLIVCLPEVAVVSAALIASSNLEHCDDFGNNTLECSGKFTVTLSLPSNASATEHVEVHDMIINSVSDGSSSYLLASPLRLSLSRSTVRYLYRTTYLQDVYAEPYEEVQTISGGFLGSFLSPCRDGHYDNSPTCGYALDSTGSRIALSQGFCCDCDLWGAITGAELHRPGTSCEFTGTHATAHCLRLKPLMYSIFSAAAPYRDYNVFARVSSADGSVYDVVKVSPSVPLGTGLNNSLEVAIIGDFSDVAVPPSLSATYLAVPSRPASDPLVARRSPADWRFIPVSRFDFSGTGCNKIGVSYGGFYAQAQRCNVRAGSCLGGQIASLGPTEYKGDSIFGSTPASTMAWDAVDPSALSVVSNSAAAAVVTLTFRAGSLRFIRQVARGVIVSAVVTAPSMPIETTSRGSIHPIAGINDSRTTLQEFSLGGIVLVTVQNIGSISARFQVSLEHCSERVHPVPATFVEGLEASATAVARIEPLTVSVPDVTDAVNVSVLHEHHCNVSLHDARGVKVDSTVVHFSTSPMVHTGGTPVTTSVVFAPSGSVDSDSSCTAQCSWYSISCNFSVGCYTEGVAIIASSVVLFLFMLMLLFCCCKLHLWRLCVVSKRGSNPHAAPAEVHPVPPIVLSERSVRTDLHTAPVPASPCTADRRDPVREMELLLARLDAVQRGAPSQFEGPTAQELQSVYRSSEVNRSRRFPVPPINDVIPVLSAQQGVESHSLPSVAADHCTASCGFSTLSHCASKNNSCHPSRIHSAYSAHVLDASNTCSGESASYFRRAVQIGKSSGYI